MIQKEYILYGVGYEGEKFIYSNHTLIEQIVYCIDAFHTGLFHGIPVVTLEMAKDIKKYHILVAAVFETYKIIKNILEEKGLKEHVNFSWASTYGKKIVVINANCHGTPIRQILMNNYEFRKKYVIYPIPFVHENEEIDKILLQHIDVYIHQIIRKEGSVNYKVSDKYVIPKLKKECINIAIPNLYPSMGEWIYPQQLNGGLTTLKLKNGVMHTFYEDMVLEQAYEKKLTRLSEYIDFYINYRIEDEVLQKTFDNAIEKLKLREEEWNITILDYILNNYRKTPLFVDKGHPSKFLMDELGKRILKYLGCGDTEMFSEELKLTQLGLPTPVLPCVKEYFKFEYEITLPMNTRSFSLGDVLEDDLSNYIREYLWWSHELIVD